MCHTYMVEKLVLHPRGSVQLGTNVVEIVEDKQDFWEEMQKYHKATLTYS